MYMEGLEEPRSSGSASKESPKHPTKDLSFPPVIVMCKLFDTVPVLQIYITSAHKSTHCCSNGRTEMIPCTTTHTAKSNQVFCPPSATKYPTPSSRRVNNNILQCMRDLHSADLPIGTTEPITSHNECLQVAKSSAIAKHLTEWSDILWKDSHNHGLIYYGKTAITQGIQQS